MGNANGLDISMDSVLRELQSRHQKAIEQVELASADVDRFQELCQVLRDTGLVFSAFASWDYVSEKMGYVISLNSNAEVRNAGQLIMTLCRMNCTQKHRNVSEYVDRNAETLDIACDDAPDFRVVIWHKKTQGVPA